MSGSYSGRLGTGARYGTKEAAATRDEGGGDGQAQGDRRARHGPEKGPYGRGGAGDKAQGSRGPKRERMEPRGARVGKRPGQAQMDIVTYRLIWSKGSLQDFVRDIFSDKITLSHEGIKLGTQFTARNLDRVTGFRVELPTNLADHLRLRYEDRTVSLFHHASFLQCQKNNSLFPAGLTEETLRTLALLFTQGDKDTQKWYYKQNNPEELDTGVFKCGHLRDDYRQIEKYTFWHDRLVILKEAFDESQPKTVSQLWNDRREGNQWYALWVAIGITLFFGLVQSIEGALQVYKAYNPLS